MKKNNVDLIVGGSILIAIIVLIVSVLWLKEVNVSRKMVSYTVLFPNISTLQLGDPVVVNGVRKGSVSTMELFRDSVAVTIQLDRSIRLTDSSRITVQNIGLMGERMIGIQLSLRGMVYPPNGRGHITYIPGYFDTGIAEAMGMLGTVLGEAQALVLNVQGIVNTTIGDTAFLTFYRTVVARLDTVTRLAQEAIANNDHKLDKVVDNVLAVSTEVREIVSSNKERISTLASNGSQLSTQALAITGRIDSLTAELHMMVEDIRHGKGSVGMLIQDERLYHDLKRSIGGLDTLVRDVKDDGLKLRVKLDFKKWKK